MAGSQPGPMFIKEEIKDQDEAESFETRYRESLCHFISVCATWRHVSCTADGQFTDRVMNQVITMTISVVRSATTPVSVCTVPVPPTQRVMPSTVGMAAVRRGLGMASFSLFSPGQDNADTDKVKKFLMTLISFSEGISAGAGAGVRRNVVSLLGGTISVPEFLRQLQMVTTFPVRPFVLPFLQANISRLRDEIQR